MHYILERVVFIAFFSKLGSFKLLKICFDDVRRLVQLIIILVLYILILHIIKCFKLGQFHSLMHSSSFRLLFTLSASSYLKIWTKVKEIGISWGTWLKLGGLKLYMADIVHRWSSFKFDREKRERTSKFVILLYAKLRIAKVVREWE